MSIHDLIHISLTGGGYMHQTTGGHFRSSKYTIFEDHFKDSIHVKYDRCKRTLYFRDYSSSKKNCAISIIRSSLEIERAVWR